MDSLLRDLRFALRQLRRTPAFTVAAVACLALGIGANTAIFTVINARAGAPAAVSGARAPGDAVWERTRPRAASANTVAPGRLPRLEGQSRVFERMAAMYDMGVNLTGDGEPARGAGGVRDARISSRCWASRRSWAGPSRAEEDAPGGRRVVVLSHGLWQRRFGGARDVVGQAVSLNGEPYTVIGVLAAGRRPGGPAARRRTSGCRSQLDPAHGLSRERRALPAARWRASSRA